VVDESMDLFRTCQSCSDLFGCLAYLVLNKSLKELSFVGWY
jgi:hypothetical protein